MLYHISHILTPFWSPLNVVHYVSFRAIAALLSSLLFSFIIGSWFIDKSKQFFRSKAREWTPERHKAKDDMPTMGGIFMLMVVVINVLLWSDLTNKLVWIFLLSICAFGAIGGWDDWSKIRYRKGISARNKIMLQIGVATVTIMVWLWIGHSQTDIVFPFFKAFHPNIGWFFVPWAVFVLVGCSNAVNLTDGLDGLAITSLLPNFVIFSLIAYLAGHLQFASYLHIPFAGTAEIAVIGAMLIGASLGFLWYNAYPAQIFMGDVGSLALGAALALMALMAKQELLLPIAGGLFVVEAISVIAQVFSYRFLGRRILKMAPLHHHFELMGWPESKITVRFGIISLVLCLLAVITLKLR
ncbi:MAG TPA: phospho-N-acetylmuramoyl-pentapeptide-transferase [Candidatus Dependentiae bacterium]|nr:phospho-N-acetylmuramoyl-pentapeptide-transferase [Candidatus Dependentiae bacterium]HRQ62796.1 phospho-N-acetylmuramoyl-pentapeptide-transferase [Candidatus Dependentiae bacterium]